MTPQQIADIASGIWTPATLVAAVLAGLLMGYTIVGWLATNPTYANLSVTARRIGVLVVLVASFVGLVFWAGQAAATAAEGDSAWPRVVGRFALWMVYAVFLGWGTHLRVVHNKHRRRSTIRHQAEVEVAARVKEH